MKTTSNGRRPQNIKIGISQQPRTGSYSNFKLKLRWPNNIFKSLKWRRPLMEDDLKILEVECLSNHLLDLTQTLNLGLDDQTIFQKSSKWRRTSNWSVYNLTNEFLEENSEEISSVALLSPACFVVFLETYFIHFIQTFHEIYQICLLTNRWRAYLNAFQCVN